MSDQLLRIVLVVLCIALSACTATSNFNLSASEADEDRLELLRLNEQLARSQIVARDAAFLSEIAADEFRVLAPGGLIENKEQAMAGVGAWDASDVSLTGTQIVFHGAVAIITGRMDIDGEMRPVGRWGPLKYMSTWQKEDGKWTLLSRSLTPCLDMLIKLGRC